MKIWSRCAMIVGLLSLSVGGVRADDNAAEPVQQRTKMFTAALAGGKAESVAAMFTVGGEHVRDGVAVRGRENLTRASADLFKQRQQGMQVEAETSNDSEMIGEDTGTPVSEDYKVPFKFTGEIEKVTIKITEHPLTPEQLQKFREAQVKAALSRQP